MANLTTDSTGRVIDLDDDRYADWFIHPDVDGRAVSHKACALVEGGALLEHAEDAEYQHIGTREACLFCGQPTPRATPEVEAAAAALED